MRGRLRRLQFPISVQQAGVSERHVPGPIGVRTLTSWGDSVSVPVGVLGAADPLGLNSDATCSRGRHGSRARIRLFPPSSFRSQEPAPKKSFAPTIAVWMLAVILGSTLLAQDAADAVDEALLAKLQGEWRYAGMTANGKPQNRDW